jgi:phage tail-like protein
MKATEQSGYLFANDGGSWPGFNMARVVASAAGELQLKTAGAGYETSGAFSGGPFEALPGATPWFRAEALGPALPGRTHLQLFAFTSDGPAPVVALAGDSPFDGWQAGPPDTSEFILSAEPSRLLWIGGTLRGDGTASPSVAQIRIEYGREGWVRNLPAIYRQEDSSRDLLERILALEQSRLGGLDAVIDDLPLLMDPHAAPSAGYPSWLEWLSSWLAFPLNEHWTDQQKRDYLAEAFTLYARRGTIAGLRRYIKMYADVEANIIEPARTASLWILGESSSLGFSTMLAPGGLGGAVLSSTATLNQSKLAPAGDRGASLFDDVAHRFCVSVWCGELTRPGALADLEAVIEREKPAHTVAELCLVHPGTRVGAARVGINTIAGDGLPPAQIGGRLNITGLSALNRDCKEKAHV